MKIPGSALPFLMMLAFTAEPLAATFVCPSFVDEIPAVSSHSGSWLVVAPRGDRPLNHVGIYLGDPVKYGALLPDSAKTSGDAETVTWHLRRSKDDQLWVGCSYAGTSAMLFSKLDGSISKCVASYDLLPSRKRLRLRSMECE